MGSCCSTASVDESHAMEPVKKTAGTLANTEEDRAARLAAAERRQQQMDRRGVKPGGGRLANKLKQKNQGGQEAELPQDNLQWRVD